MKVYTVYRNPNATTEEDRFAFVPEEFSWWAFFFPFNIVWALKNQCWLMLTICLSLFAIYINSYVNPSDLSPYINITKLPVQMMLGIFANDFLRHKLIRKGYYFVDVISAPKEPEAIKAYLSKASTN